MKESSIIVDANRTKGYALIDVRSRDDRNRDIGALRELD